jgi:hypothetical protein
VEETVHAPDYVTNAGTATHCISNVSRLKINR